MAATNGSFFASSAKAFSALAVKSSSGNKATRLLQNPLASNFTGNSLSRSGTEKTKVIKIDKKVSAATSTAISTVDDIKESTLPSWTMFELGKAPVYWKTMNGLPPTSGERLRIFYNPAANNVVPHAEFGIAFNGGFNQPIMCGGEPRVMKMKERGKADSPIYSIQICIPKHAVNLIFSFTNGAEWDGPYRLQFQVPRRWRNKPIEFFNKGLGEELSKEGACDRAIFPDATRVVDRCALVGNLTVQGGDRCELNLVPGCTDPNSPEYDPLANVDDGSCLVDIED